MHLNQPSSPTNSIAVAGSHGVWTRAGYTPGRYTFEDLDRQGVKQLWLAAEADLSQVDLPHFRPLPGRRFSVTVPSLSPQLAMFDLVANSLHHELERFEQATGELFVQSPAVTSDVILRHCHQGPGCRPVTATAEPQPARRIQGRAPEGAEGDLVWWADFNSEVRLPYPERGFLQHFDLNAAYLGSVSSLALPQGEPRYYQRGSLPGLTWTPDLLRRPGYFLVEQPLPSKPGWPPIARNRGMRNGQTTAWITTPTLEMAMKLGEVVIHSAWLWFDSCQGLRPWYETLRRAREQLRSGPAYEAVKRIYKAGIGRLGSTRRAREDDPLYQPTWRHLVIAEARSRVWRRLAAAPIPPIAVQVDGAWWITPMGDPAEAAAWLGLPLDPIRLGHWKHQGTGSGQAAIEALTYRDPIARLRELTGAWTRL